MSAIPLEGDLNSGKVRRDGVSIKLKKPREDGSDVKVLCEPDDVAGDFNRLVVLQLEGETTAKRDPVPNEVAATVDSESTRREGFDGTSVVS